MWLAIGGISDLAMVTQIWKLDKVEDIEYENGKDNVLKTFLFY